MHLTKGLDRAAKTPVGEKPLDVVMADHHRSAGHSSHGGLPPELAEIAAGVQTVTGTEVCQRPPPGVATLGEPLNRLTPRELDTLRAIARGLSNSEIGAELFLSE
ncbi:MAG TPA: LuxR C-terminal-related transcriptional regulator, partial [Acidimicrobiales bacterium]|nr:LuxR C-terminal-related transcriptional regulator [Acidimicrobiales bacterium]